MQSEAVWQRALVLFRQQRWDLAMRELHALLSQQPDHAPAHALLAHALANTADLDGALAEARRAIALDPEMDFGYGALAAVHWQRRELEPAAAAIQRAIELDPHDASHRSTLAQIRLGQRRWQDALAAADAGLALEPEDTDCLNLRAMALARLGRAREADDSVDASLARDPDNPFTHQTRGFALLHRGDAKGALHHFQEALRRDPTLDGARAGLVEALKARNPLYRVVLAWFLWLERFAGPKSIAIIIGLFLAARFGSRALRDTGHPTAATIVSFSWLAFVLLTSCAVPIFNLLLLLHPVGRHALERRARNDALLLGACVVIGAGVALHGWLGEAAWSDSGWLFWLVFLLPVSGIGVFHPGWARTVLQVFCTGALAFWLWWCVRAGPALASEATAKEHAALFLGLLMAVAFSTWFVLLAPKGRPPRRRPG